MAWVALEKVYRCTKCENVDGTGRYTVVGRRAQNPTGPIRLAPVFVELYDPPACSKCRSPTLPVLKSNDGLFLSADEAKKYAELTPVDEWAAIDLMRRGKGG